MRHFLEFEKPIAELEGKIEELRRTTDAGGIDVAEEIGRLGEKAQALLKTTYAKLSPWQKAQVARHPDRPHATDYIAALIQDFTPLAAPVARHVRAVLLIGRDAPALRTALADTGVNMIDCASLPEAVVQAAGLAQPGETVLLSPACASMDMFANYVQRAQVFIDAVRELGLARGEVIA